MVWIIRFVAVLVALTALTACPFDQPRVFVEELREVPDVVGEPVADARAHLEAEGFSVNVLEEGATPPATQHPAGFCDGGTVTAQEPGAGEELRAAETVALTARGC